MIPKNDQDALRQCFLFTSLSDHDIGILSQICRSVRYPGGTEIFAMGDPADGLRIITQGEVRIWMSDTDGRELTITMLESGDSFGEIALLDGLPRSAAASATEATSCLFVPHSAVNDLLESDPRFAKEIIHSLCEILRRNSQEMSAVAFQSLESRLAQKLCDLAVSRAAIDGVSARFTKKLPQTDLAKMLGVTREAVNKRLMGLAQQNLIETQDGFLLIPDLDKLATHGK